MQLTTAEDAPRLEVWGIELVWNLAHGFQGITFSRTHHLDPCSMTKLTRILPSLP